MRYIRHLSSLAAWQREHHRQDPLIALIPTMGTIHSGHLALIDKAHALNALVMVSVFVNRLQFHDTQDYLTYPVSMDEDQKLLKQHGVHVLFAPSAQELQIDRQQTFIEPCSHLAAALCGPHRQGHFRGVCTIVMKLLMLVRPHIAIFGEKDYQQLRIIETMVQDFHIPTRILAVPTVRESSGLALSSRNRRLSPHARQTEAPMIYRSLQNCLQAYATHTITLNSTSSYLKQQLQMLCPNITVEYSTVLTASLKTPEQSHSSSSSTESIYLFCAVFLENVRLIDHICLHSAS